MREKILILRKNYTESKGKDLLKETLRATNPKKAEVMEIIVHLQETTVMREEGQTESMNKMNQSMKRVDKDILQRVREETTNKPMMMKHTKMGEIEVIMTNLWIKS
jgi:hypothetical protein